MEEKEKINMIEMVTSQQANNNLKRSQAIKRLNNERRKDIHCTGKTDEVDRRDKKPLVLFVSLSPSSFHQ